MANDAFKTATTRLSCEHASSRSSNRSRDEEEQRSEAQSINLTSIAEEVSRYMTPRKPHLIYPEGGFRQSLPSQRVNLALKKILLAISCHWESKARVQKKKRVLPSQRMQGWGKMLGEQEEKNAQN